MGKSTLKECEIAFTVATFLLNTHRLHKVVDFYNKAQSLLKPAQFKDPNICKLLLCLLHTCQAYTLHSLGSLNEALAKYKEALQVSQAVGGLRELDVTIYSRISDIYSSLGKQEEVIFYESKLLEIAKETGDKQREVRAYENIGHACFVLNRHHKSIEFENETLRVSRQTGFRQRESCALFNPGSAFKALSQYDKAVSHLNEALQIRREIRDLQEEAKLHQQLGDTYHELKAFDKALDCHTKSLELKITVRDIFEQGV